MQGKVVCFVGKYDLFVWHTTVFQAPHQIDDLLKRHVPIVITVDQRVTVVTPVVLPEILPLKRSV